ncbi:MAG: hypothetical protein VB108_10915 [Anaerolineaceae bacterium]|nr:hypothetical protein [Anaerolineaceae bacterium]
MTAKNTKKTVSKKQAKKEPEISLESIVSSAKDDGFEKSKALTRKEIEELKDQLEDLNRSNTTGG